MAFTCRAISTMVMIINKGIISTRFFFIVSIIYVIGVHN